MKRLLPLVLASAFSAAVASPTAPVVVNGQATFSQNGNVFTITNTPNTIINWQSFSVAPGEVTRFVQQSASSAVLNRILGQDPSQILGSLQSNGHVFLINPNGILFGEGARIDVNGLTASTLNITDADFLGGRKTFSAGAVAGNIQQQGSITTPSGGQVFLVAPNVDNTGIITSPQGDVVLAAGRQVELVNSRDPDLHVVVSAPEDRAINLGQVVAQGGRIGIYGALVNQRGTVNANSAVVGQDGKIVLKASGDTMLEAGSSTTATGAGAGGTVHVLGNRVGMVGDAAIDVSGETGGGTVLVGGDYLGRNPAIQSAEQAWLGKDAVIRADARQAGNGGKVILWATGATRAFGTISARGGAQSGNGGFIETSADYLDVQGVRVDTSALNGARGLWLLDPMNITVGLPTCGLDLDCISVADAQVFSRAADASGLVSVADLLSATSDIRLEAKENIRFRDALDAGSKSITARAGNSIYVDAPLTSGGGSITLSANEPTFGSVTGNGSIFINQAVSAVNGAVSMTGKEVSIGATGSLTARSVSLLADRLSVGGDVDGSQSIMVAPLSAGMPIRIGGETVDDSQSLNLNNDELSKLRTPHLSIGAAGLTGGVWLGPTVYTNAPAGKLTIDAGTRGIHLDGAVTTNGMLELKGSGDIYQSAYVGERSIATPHLHLQGNGVNGVSVDLTSDFNHIGILTGTNLASLRIINEGDLVLGDGVTGITLGESAYPQASIATTGLLTVRNTIDAGTGRIELEADSVQLGLALKPSGASTGTTDAALNAATIAIQAPAFSMSKGASMNAVHTIEFVTDKFQLEQGALIRTAETGYVGITPYSHGTGIELGAGATDGMGTLGLSEAELQAIDSYSLSIGDSVEGYPGLVSVVGSLDLTGSPNLRQMDIHLGAAGMRVGANAALRVQDYLHIGSADALTPAGAVIVDGTLEASGTLLLEDGSMAKTGTITLEAQSLGGTGWIKAHFASLDTIDGIGSEDAPLKTQLEGLWAQTARYGASAPLNIVNNSNQRGSLVITGLHQYGDGLGSIQLKNFGPLIVANAEIDTAVRSQSGSISLVSDDILMIDGLVKTTSGDISLAAGATSDLVITDLGKVQSDSGSISLAAGAAIVEPAGSVATGAPGRITRVAGDVAPPPPAPTPQLPECIANPSAAGCEAVLPTMTQCLVNPTMAGCEAVLPNLVQCIAEPGRTGCTVVLPTMAECIGSPSLPGCSAILPKLEVCAVNPNAPGCEAVLPKPGYCAAHPTDPSCQLLNPRTPDSSKSPVKQAEQTTITLVNGATPATAGNAAPAPGEAGKQDAKEKAEGDAKPEAAQENSGVKNEKPATKTYCN